MAQGSGLVRALLTNIVVTEDNKCFIVSDGLVDTVGKRKKVRFLVLSILSYKYCQKSQWDIFDV